MFLIESRESGDYCFFLLVRKMSHLYSPKISVVVPFYNSIAYVLNAINNLKKQTFEPFEVILVDDGSEESLSKVKGSIVGDVRFSLVSQPHLGAGEARNCGLELVKGDYVIFLDSDDRYDKKLLEKMFLSATKWNSDTVLCNANSEDNPDWSVLHVDHLNKEWADAREVQNELFQLSSPAPWNKLIRTALIRENKLRFLPLQNSNDITFTYSALALSERISWVNERLLQYGRSNPNSLQRLKDKNPSNIIRALEGLQDNLSKYRKVEFLQDSFFQMVYENIFWNFKTFKRTTSRQELLNSYIDSKLYDTAQAYNRSNHNEKNRNLFAQLELLRATFFKNHETHFRKVCNTKKRRFSVIIPFFNDERFISIPLTSLKSQTFKDFNVILVNDGSFDNSKEVILKIIDGDQRFQIFDRTNQGLSNSRNFGLSQTNSDYVIFLDSDDALTPDCLAKLNQNIEKYKPEIIFFEAKTVNSYSDYDGQASKRCNELDEYYTRRGEYNGLLKGPQVMSEAFKSGEFIASACLSAVQKSFLDEHKIRFIPNILHEDNPYTFELLLTSKSVLVLKEKLYWRTVRPESITTKKNNIRNVWGYYLSFQKTQDLLRKSQAKISLDEDQALAFQNISYGFLRAARNISSNIPNPSLFLLFLPKDQKFIFEKLIKSPEVTMAYLTLSNKERKLIMIKRKFVNFLRNLL